MSTKYICRKCNYESELLKDIVKHLKKKNKCLKRIQVLNYSDDQLLVLSLLSDNEKVKDNEIQKFIDSNILYNNSNEFLDIIENINKSKTKKCTFCNITFSRIVDLRRHIIIECFYNELHKRNDINNENFTNKNININNTSITNNIVNNNYITNNVTNIFLEINHPVGFDENWDTSEIGIEKKSFITINKLMYTTLLEELLKNKSNLNVILDKESNKGIVYKNDIEEYIEMKTKDIIDNTMEKLKNQLLDINNDVQKYALIEHTDFNRKIITKKHIDYINKKDVKEKVSDYIIDIFDKKKEEAKQLCIPIMNKNVPTIESII